MQKGWYSINKNFADHVENNRKTLRWKYFM